MPAEIPVGDPDNVSSIVSYLVKPEASFITGQWRPPIYQRQARRHFVMASYLS